MSEPTTPPASGLAALRQGWQADLTAGFLVSLIALPLCLGISMASGFPAVAGIFTAILGGLLGIFLGSAPLTIKGPAAGLIVIVVGAVNELGGGDPVLGYRRALAVGVAAAVIQIGFALLKAGRLGDVFPPSVVHGMLAAIGVIIFAKQVHVMLGVKPEGREPLELLAELPHSIAALNPEVALIGLLSLIVLFGLPNLPFAWAKRVPGPMAVLVLAVPLGLFFDLDHEHVYSFAWGEGSFHLGPEFLVKLPPSLWGAVTTPDFSVVTSATSIKYIVMYSLVGTIESLLSAKAVDTLDPWRRRSDLDRDLLAVGVANLAAAMIGGLPMISEIVRSSANINNGARTRWSNFFHGAFLLGFVALLPGLVQEIPLAALAAMLVYTGARLASPSEFRKTWHIGWDQALVFGATLVVTLATDLLIGVVAGVVVEAVLHLYHGAPARSILRARVEVDREGHRSIVKIRDAAVFSNYLGIRSGVRQAVVGGASSLVIDLAHAKVVDHTVMEKLHELEHELAAAGVHVEVHGLHDMTPMSGHAHAARRRA